jgi:MerR family transcriptional regulator/heat shock protein HspR
VVEEIYHVTVDIYFHHHRFYARLSESSIHKGKNFSMVREQESDPGRGVYGISVAASLVGNAPQNLRLYEARGLLAPARSTGGTRLYSENDLERLRQIGRLLEDGLNLAGIVMVLGLQEENKRLQLGLDD